VPFFRRARPVPFARQLEFGEAWIAVFDGGDPDTLLRRGAGVRGPVYMRYLNIWARDPSHRPATDALRDHWQEILAACAAQPRCSTCGTTSGRHAIYCRGA
jgi:hypothetical protein